MLSLKSLIDNKINELFNEQASLIYRLISPAIGIQLLDQNLPGMVSRETVQNFVKSKLGGMPDVADDFKWPAVDDLPLTFLGQINLSETSVFSSELPRTGVLYFFVANRKSEAYESLISTFAIIYAESDELKNKRHKKDSEDNGSYFIKFQQHYTLPSYQEKIIQDSNFYTKVQDKLEELKDYISELTSGDGDYCNRHHMLGEPNAIQGAVRMFWGAAIARPKDIYNEELHAYMELAEQIGDEFILLLQVDLCDKRIDLPNYGDNTLYFGIRKEDLLARNFGNVKLVIQNT
ncbi:DUF1963 domain-containing protein [Pedobacter sp. KLB.chiD]|uniref:DUF1963 domain-containing protein n=1 Tax=Pedobacter sp. KLB.chiD TaxID=3387402 RepID=UPI0039999824